MGELLVRYGPPLVAVVVLLCWRGHPTVRRVLLGLTISLAALTPAGRAAIAHVTGSGDLPWLIGHTGMVLTAWSAQDFLAYVNGVRRRYTWWTAGMFAAMCVLFALTPNLLPQSPWAFEYVVAYVLALAPAFAAIVRLCLRYARTVTDRALRSGLGLVVIGTSTACVYLVNKVVRAAASRFDFPYPLGHTFFVSAVLPNAAHLLVLIGATLPAALGWWRRHRAHARLRPLWQALHEAEPGIALDPSGELGLRGVRLRLYRRVIEIRDGLLALQPYRDADFATAAREAATNPRGDRSAAVEAAVIAAALRARASAAPAARSPEPVTGGLDLDSDTEYLCAVSDAFRRIQVSPDRGGGTERLSKNTPGGPQ
ncbi:hypothetical protein GCM10023148_18560 [Actinokineospora soli]